jgi:hypothetical protein
VVFGGTFTLHYPGTKRFFFLAPITNFMGWHTCCGAGHTGIGRLLPGNPGLKLSIQLAFRGGVRW